VTKPGVMGEAGAPSAGITRPVLEVQDLSVGFAEASGSVVPVTSEVSFSVTPGQTLSLVGESGCGKTVTASAIMRLLPQPSGRILSGSVRLGEREIVDLPLAELYALRGSEMAMVFQEPMTSLNPVHTAVDQVIEVLRLHRPDVTAGDRRSHALGLLEEVEFPEPARRGSSYPFQLSGGMRQRVMIAMALAGRPRLLIADEPTTALDVTVQAQILKLLRRIRQEHGMGVLYITHDMAVVSEIADQVAVMYAGQVVEAGTARELLDHPLHPYTRGLLACAPRLDSQPRTRLESIPGTVPPPRAYPASCRFADRCPLVDADCRAAPVQLRTIRGREVRCIKAGP
jgi:peptide/nickel transport system ATP-binding protein